MDLTVILSAVAIAIGFIGGAVQVRGGMATAKLDVAWQMQEKRITELTADKTDLQVRLRAAEQENIQCRKEQAEILKGRESDRERIKSLEMQVELLRLQRGQG